MSAFKLFTTVDEVQFEEPQDELLDMIYGLAGSRVTPGNQLFAFSCHQYPQFMRFLSNCSWAGRS